MQDAKDIANWCKSYRRFTLHRDWRNDVAGLGTLFSNHIPDYRNLITSHSKLTQGQ